MQASVYLLVTSASASAELLPGRGFSGRGGRNPAARGALAAVGGGAPASLG
jgi:hypothetical protein